MDPYLTNAWIFLSFQIITLTLALCCLCQIHSRAHEVKRLDSEIGTQKFDDDELSAIRIGDVGNLPLKPKHEKLENRDRQSDQGSVQAAEEQVSDNDDAN